jgi:PiT family inorganic phosphate transporter
MIKFKRAAIVTTLFVIMGAVFSGSGATGTITNLGAVNALAGSFTVALSAAITITWMTKLELPVSTSQSIVGAIIGWNLFTGSSTNYSSLVQIVTSWVASPILSALLSFLLFHLSMKIIRNLKVHMLEQDIYNRWGLLLVGAFGAYSLGANNIANVMGIFVPAQPFNDMDIWGAATFSGTQQLFLIGGIAISIGVFTYSYKVMLTVGKTLFKLTPIAALVVVFSESLVLFLFASQALADWLNNHGLPSLPLVPLSSSHAVIGGIIGIALAKRAKGINYGILKNIALAWIATPIMGGILCFVLLFFVQNVFKQKVVDHSYSSPNSHQKNYNPKEEKLVTDQKIEGFGNQQIIYSSPNIMANCNFIDNK